MSRSFHILQRISRWGFSLFAPAFFLLNPYLYALSIDKFDSEQTSEAIGPGNVAYSVNSTLSAIGGTRSMRAEVSSSSQPGALRARTLFGRFSHSQDALVVGSSTLIWDGDQNASNLNASGLGGIDFTQDGADAFKLHVISFDFPNAKPVDLVFTAYDVTDPGGNTYSKATLRLDAQVSNQFFELPFADFTTHGPAGAVDFTQIGALTLYIDGKSSDIDLTFEWLGTNGQCENLLPDQNGKVIDECGVCGGDNSSCADCLGVPNGQAVAGTSCTTTQPGVCSQGNFDSQCGCQSINRPGTELCDGIDNDCDGQVDESFPNLGANCSIGEGKCYSEGTYTCSQSLELMCDAVMIPLDDCLLAEGCDGVPGSALELDACGICGGDGTSCLDCKGKPNGKAEIDRCGVCDGDGFSCIDCEVEDISSLLRALDGGSKVQERLIKRSIQRLLRVDASSSMRRITRKIEREANTLQNENWTLSWSVDRESVSCTDTVIFCNPNSTSPIIQHYRQNSERLRDLGMEVLRIYAENSGQELRRLAKRHDRRHEKNLELADLVPKTQYVCEL